MPAPTIRAHGVVEVREVPLVGSLDHTVERDEEVRHDPAHCSAPCVVSLSARPMSPAACGGRHGYDHRTDRPEVRRRVGDRTAVGRRRTAAHRRPALLDRHRPGGRPPARGAARRRLARRRLRLLHRPGRAEAPQPRGQPARRGDHRQHRCAGLGTGKDVVVEGTAVRVTDAEALQALADAWAAKYARRLALRGARRGVRRAQRLRRQHRGRRLGLPGRAGQGAWSSATTTARRRTASDHALPAHRASTRKIVCDVRDLDTPGGRRVEGRKCRKRSWPYVVRPGPSSRRRAAGPRAAGRAGRTGRSRRRASRRRPRRPRGAGW